MATVYPVPKDLAFESLLSGIVSVPAHVARGQATDPDGNATGLFAEFVTEDDQVAVVLFADHEAVNFVGGAMAAVEAEAAREASAQTSLDDASAQQFRNVIDSFVSCINSDYTKPVRLSTVEQIPAQLSEDARHLWARPRGRRAYRITVDNYGSGAVILYFA